MGDFFVYILKSAACLIVFYLFFRLLMNRDTFHRFNRIAVLCILVLSIVIPFCKINIDTRIQVNQAVAELHQLFVEPDSVAIVEQPDQTLTWLHGILLIYLAGIIFFVSRNIYFLVRIRCLIQRSKIEKLKDRIKLVVCDDAISPFGWMNYIVISETDLKENGKEIITHEMAHVRKRHSLDILLADICVVFQWFNPAIWLVKQELQNIHEYEADEYVLNEGIDAKHYQILLIKKAVGKRLYSMANSFNHSKLKKRITMMSKQKSSPWARLKYLYVLPVTAVAITAFARPEISSELNKISEVKVSDFAEMTKIVDVTKGNSLSDDTINVSGVANTTVEGYKKKDASRVLVTGNDVVVVKGSKKSVSTSAKDQLVLNVSGDVILETEDAKVPIVYEANHIIINHRDDKVSNSNSTSENVRTISGVVKDSSGNPIAGASVVIVGTKTGTITGMDGKFVLEVPNDATLAISMIDMKSVSVKVDKSSFLTITLPSQTSDKRTTVSLSHPNDVVVVGKPGNAQAKRPLVIVNGKKNSDGISKLETFDIESINVLQKEDAVKQYGTEGENGVIIVTTKNK
ncbi:MAG: carboxypeptidase-like regulatory domain-containing protein [Dysgonomonas sp.]